MTSKYMNQFISLTCAPDLLARKLFPNPKEICESMACYDAVYRFWPDEIKRDDPEVCVAVLGDGHVPRTGAMFAFRSKHQVVSIDPEMRDRWLPPVAPRFQVQRLSAIKGLAERQHIEADKLVLVSVHGHVPLMRIISEAKFKTCWVVSMPCCMPDIQILKRRVGYVYQDADVPSPKNLIYGWRFQ